MHHLLSHTAGLGDYPASVNFRRDYDEDKQLELIYGSKLLFVPGEGWRYSNLGYITLGIVLHRGQASFTATFWQSVFRPLKMSSARVISEADIVPHRAAGYRLVKGELKNQQWVAPSLNTTADGSLYLTILDLAAWDAGLRGGQLLAQPRSSKCGPP